MMLTTTDVVRLAHSRPWASKPWSAELLEVFPDRLERAVDRWRLSIERAHLEGAGLPVLEVRARLGSAAVPAVVKFDGAGSDLQQQLRVLLAADGTGYVRVLEHDAELGVVLLERLGPTLSRELRDPVSQGDVIAGLLEQAWQLPLQVGLPFAPGEKAVSLLAAIEEAPEAPVNPPGDGQPGGGASSRAGAAEPVRRRAVEHARDLARELAASPSSTQVVAHGDPHPCNVLRRGAKFTFIDPDGFRCEPEYDAAVALRDHQLVIDQLEQNQGAGAGRRWHRELVRRLALRLELDVDRVAAWAFVERVTTGLHLSALGYLDEGESWLATADTLVG